MMLSSCTVVGSNGGVSFSVYESLTVVGEARVCVLLCRCTVVCDSSGESLHMQGSP